MGGCLSIARKVGFITIPAVLPLGLICWHLWPLSGPRHEHENRTRYGSLNWFVVSVDTECDRDEDGQTTQKERIIWTVPQKNTIKPYRGIWNFATHFSLISSNVNYTMWTTNGRYHTPSRRRYRIYLYIDLELKITRCIVLYIK